MCQALVFLKHPNQFQSPGVPSIDSSASLMIVSGVPNSGSKSSRANPALPAASIRRSANRLPKRPRRHQRDLSRSELCSPLSSPQEILRHALSFAPRNLTILTRSKIAIDSFPRMRTYIERQLHPAAEKKSKTSFFKENNHGKNNF